MGLLLLFYRMLPVTCQRVLFILPQVRTLFCHNEFGMDFPGLLGGLFILVRRTLIRRTNGRVKDATVVVGDGLFCNFRIVMGAVASLRVVSRPLLVNGAVSRILCNG